MINFDKFSIDWIADGSKLFNNETSFTSCTVDFVHRQIPKISMVVRSFNPDQICSVTDSTIKIVLEDNTSMSFPFYVVTRKIDGNNITLIGLSGTADFLRTCKSSYLGDNLSDAMKKVSGTRTIGFDTSVSGDFFQFNETDYHCLLRLLKGCSDSNSFEFTDSSIELINDSEVFELENGSTIGFDFKQVTDDNSVPVLDENTDYFTQGWNKTVNLESSSTDWVRNYLSTIKYEKACDYIITYRFLGVPHCFVGGTAKCSVPTLTKEEFMIIGKIIYMSASEPIQTDIILGADL